MTDKYPRVLQRLSNKIDQSKTKVPGFIVGLSGTDSLVAFDLLYNALIEKQMEHRLIGIHYVKADRRKLTWFEEHILPWMRMQYPHAKVMSKTPLGGNQDWQRWADLHLRSLNSIDDDGKTTTLDAGENYWIAGTINATEYKLGTYSVIANTASIQPIRSIWKSEIIEICKMIGVPDIAIEYSRIPDCFCGRDELAANNIELIDKILRYEPVDLETDLHYQLTAYINDTMKANEFKQRIPYVV